MQWITGAGLVVAASLAGAQQEVLPASLVDEVTAAVDQDTSRLDGIFKDLHKNTGLGFMEERTAGIFFSQVTGTGSW